MITAFLSKWGAKFLGALAVVATALGGLAMYGRSKKRQGASEEREKSTKKVQENVEKAREVRRDRNPRDRSRVSKFDRKPR